jgi:hypothetical protein
VLGASLDVGAWNLDVSSASFPDRFSSRSKKFSGPGGVKMDVPLDALIGIGRQPIVVAF